MPTPNPDFNPEWKSLHDQHVARQEALEQQIEELQNTDDESESHYHRLQQLTQQADQELQARLKTFRMQHRTIQEYAEWMFSSFPVDRSLHGESIPTFLPDFETFTTIEQVSEAWSEHRKAAQEAADMIRNKLPVGRPDNQDIFEPGPDRQISSHPRTFSHEDIFGRKGNISANTVITADIRPDAIHLCLTDLFHIHKGLSVINTIENLATCLYHEITSNQQQSMAQEYNQSSQAMPSLYRPEQLHFYIHMPPGERKEAFIAVQFTSFENGRYESVEWNHAKVIPKVIQDAWTKNPQVNMKPPPALTF